MLGKRVGPSLFEKIDPKLVENLELKDNLDLVRNWYDYFLKRRNGSRKFFLEAIAQLLLGKDKIFISISCGFAGEESWVVDRAKMVYLIDASNSIYYAKIFYELEKDMVATNVVFIKDDYKNFCLKSREKADVIYCSGPSDWAHSFSLYEGVPREYCSFVEKNLSKDGVFVCILYGGILSNKTFTSSGLFLNFIKQSLIEYNLCLEEQKYMFDDDTGEYDLCVFFIRHIGAEFLFSINYDNLMAVER